MSAPIDDLLHVQAQRLRALCGRETVATSAAGTVAEGGQLVEVPGAAAVVEIVTWASDAYERVVLGDRTVRIRLAALPDPSVAADPVAELLAAVRALVEPVADLRTDLLLSWPAEDTAMHEVFVGAGLTHDAVWSIQEVDDIGASPGRDGVLVRAAMPSDADTVADLAEEETRYHLPFTEFTRMLPVVRSVPAAAVRTPDPACPVMVVELGGRVVGYCYCRVVDVPDDGVARLAAPGRSAHVVSAGVHESARGTGVGTTLVAATLRTLASMGAARVSTAFVPTNPLASRFWPARGFRPRWHYYMARL